MKTVPSIEEKGGVSYAMDQMSYSGFDDIPREKKLLVQVGLRKKLPDWVLVSPASKYSEWSSAPFPQFLLKFLQISVYGQILRLLIWRNSAIFQTKSLFWVSPEAFLARPKFYNSGTLSGHFGKLLEILILFKVPWRYFR